MKYINRFLMLVMLVIFSGCGNDTNNTYDETEETQPKIYTTIYPLQFLVEEIGGETVEAITVYPPGVDEHTYEPTSRGLTEIADGLAFFYIGAGLEAFADTAAEALAGQDVKLVEIGENEELFLEEDDHHDHGHEGEEGHDDHHHHGDIDPHIWLDPVRMAAIAEIITEELSQLFPEEEESFTRNLSATQDALYALDEEFETLIHSKENKNILVTHAAFGYWEESYDLNQISIHGISTENEPSQKALVEIIDTANEHGIRHIIFEQNVSTRVAEVIQEEIGAESLVLHNLSVLTEEDIAGNRDYFSIMRDNLDVLNEAMNQ